MTQHGLAKIQAPRPTHGQGTIPGMLWHTIWQAISLAECHAKMFAVGAGENILLRPILWQAKRVETITDVTGCRVQHAFLTQLNARPGPWAW